MEHGPFDDVIAAFNSDDGDHRVELLAGCLEEDGEVAHIHGIAVGPCGFSKDIGAIRQGFPGLVAKLDGEVETLQRWDRQAWALVDETETVFATGAYIGRRADSGKYSHLVSLPNSHGTTA